MYETECHQSKKTFLFCVPNYIQYVPFKVGHTASTTTTTLQQYFSLHIDVTLIFRKFVLRVFLESLKKGTVSIPSCLLDEDFYYHYYVVVGKPILVTESHTQEKGWNFHEHHLLLIVSLLLWILFKKPHSKEIQHVFEMALFFPSGETCFQNIHQICPRFFFLEEKEIKLAAFSHINQLQGRKKKNETFIFKETRGQIEKTFLYNNTCNLASCSGAMSYHSVIEKAQFWLIKFLAISRITFLPFSLPISFIPLWNTNSK